MPPRRKARANAAKGSTVAVKVTTVKTKVAVATTSVHPAAGAASDPVSVTARKRRLPPSDKTAAKAGPSKRVARGSRQTKQAKPLVEASKELERTPEVSKEPEPTTEVSKEPEPMAEVSKEPEPIAEVSKEPEPMAEVSKEPEPMTEVSKEPEPMTGASKEPEPMTEVSKEPEPMTGASKEPVPMIEVSKESRPVAEAPKGPTVGEGSKMEVEPARPEPTAVVEKPKETKKAPTKKRVPARPIYEDLWKEVYLAGTEWGQIKMVYDIDWDFDHLDDAVTDGELADKQVHLFGATEPQLLMRDEKDEKGQVIPVPVIVAIVSDVAPPSTVGIKSVQRAEEEILPMSEVRMGWHPYAPDNVSVARFKPKVHVLKCNERRARLRNMQEAAVHRYDYVLPYLIRPDDIDDVTVNTVVQVLAELEGRKTPLMCEFDYEFDELDEFVEEQISENELDAEKHSEPLKSAIREAVKATKLKYRAEKEERKKRIDAIPQEERDAIKKMQLLKFYPMNDWPDVSDIKSPFINRYYGRATKVL